VVCRSALQDDVRAELVANGFEQRVDDISGQAEDRVHSGLGEQFEEALTDAQLVLVPRSGTGLPLAGTLRTERDHEYPSSISYPLRNFRSKRARAFFVISRVARSG
jgi:hypothetical protein